MSSADLLRQRLRERRQRHRDELQREARRLGRRAAALGVERVVLFGSAAWGQPGLTSDLDLLIVWETDLGVVERTVALYRQLRPRVPVDLLVYTPSELQAAAHKPLVRRALEEGEVLYAA